MEGFTDFEGERFMIIELRDLPQGAAIKAIDCHIEFSSDGTVKSITTAPKVAPTPSVPRPEPQNRPENIAPEMQDLKF